MWQQLKDGWLEILNIQKFRRMAGYTTFYCFTALISYAYTSNTKRAGFSNADQFYSSYPIGTELLTDTGKLYKAALGNCFEIEEWGPIEWSILAKHFERQGKSPYAYHAASLVFVYHSDSLPDECLSIYVTPNLSWGTGRKRLAYELRSPFFNNSGH